MKTKWPLFLGIILLFTGIVLKSMAIQSAQPLILILSGVAFKLYYIINKILIGAYKPGFEVLLLFIGLATFLTGIYFKNHTASFNYLYLVVPGLALKASFVVLFILKSRNGNSETL